MTEDELIQGMQLMLDDTYIDQLMSAFRSDVIPDPYELDKMIAVYYILYGWHVSREPLLS